MTDTAADVDRRLCCRALDDESQYARFAQDDVVHDGLYKERRVKTARLRSTLVEMVKD